ncbi:MAG: ATP-dependent DNA helicase RecG [Planctomycetes bacterium]|nr:ATP-dependent DNA helicase RecG [Planctomycetota bacterium]
MASPSGIDSKTPLQLVPGIGAQKASLLERLGLRRAIDLLFFFPRTYQDVQPWNTTLELTENTRACVLGTVIDMDSRFGFDGRSSVGVLLEIEGGGYLRCVWYNQPFRREQFSIGRRVLATGVIKSSGVASQMRHPEVLLLAEGEEPPPAKPIPIYPLTEGLQQRNVVQSIAAVMPLIEHVEEALPLEVRERAAQKLASMLSASKASISNQSASPTSEPSWVGLPLFDGDVATTAPPKLLSIHDALRMIHQPETMVEAHDARLRFIFQELFVLQLALAMHRYQTQYSKPAPNIPSNAMVHARILKRFPFDLTSDQTLAIEDIRRDMAREIPMNRLIQGDVGTGKTALAQYAMLSAVANHYQAAMMVPTELLARQHHRKLCEQLKNSKVMIELLVGSISGKDKRELLQRIAIGTVDIVVGTQALISEHVEFAKLGLLVIDEQHRFGVEQRASLRKSRTVPHYLVMTATPIPRTLAMTVFGDLDVSILRQRPPGQSVVQTYVSEPAQQERWWKFVLEQVHSGRQAFVVAPRVEATGDEDAAGESVGAIQQWEILSQGPLAGLRVGLVHGRMDGDEKQQKIDDFVSGKIQVLVATTVIEVGIDVPNASVMTILDADRLGLAQLHQLRGRVGRGRFPGYVCLFPRADIGSEELERLKLFASNHDGFALAELDLKLRGPGELLGTRQTGLPTLRIADLSRDSEILQLARSMACEIIATDPLLNLPEHAKLRRQVVAKHGATLEISDVG